MVYVKLNTLSYFIHKKLYISLVGPKITEGLKDISVLNGNPFELYLKLTGIPQPEVQWFLEDSLLEQKASSITFQNEGDLYTFKNLSSTPNVAGKYKVIVTNSGGSVESSAVVTVLTLPVITNGTESVELIEGEIVSLKVNIQGVPNPSVSWFKESKEIVNSDEHKVSSSGDSFCLEILKSKLSDCGIYVVVASNSVGEARFSTTVNVLVPPKIVEEMKNCVVLDGEELAIQCKVMGVPEPVATWTKDDKSLKASEKTKFLQEDGIFSLKKSNMADKDEGKYSVSIENKAGKVSLSSSVRVLKLPSFTKGLNNLEILENEDLQLEVEFSGKPLPSPQWLKDGQEMKPDKRIKITKNETKYTLLIKKATQPDAGLYKCIISNEAGENFTEGLVSVHSKPQVTKKMKDAVVMVGEPLTLETQFGGNPQPEITWLKDEKLLPTNEADPSTYHIGSASLEDAGVYTVVGKNLVGESKAVTKVKVVQAPFFITGLSDATIVDKQLLKLEAEIDGHPAPDVEWMKDGKAFGGKKTGQEKFTFQKEGKIYSLNVPKAAMENEGTYTLTAKNQAGEAKSEAKITVQGRS